MGRGQRGGGAPAAGSREVSEPQGLVRRRLRRGRPAARSAQAAAAVSSDEPACPRGARSHGAGAERGLFEAAEMATKRLARCGPRHVPPGPLTASGRGAGPRPPRVGRSPLGPALKPPRPAGCWGWRGAAGAARAAAGRRSGAPNSTSCSSSTSSPPAGGTRGNAAPRSVSAAPGRPGLCAGGALVGGARARWPRLTRAR